jgi:glycerol-3-phosphate acyltransferase PlsY
MNILLLTLLTAVQFLFGSLMFSYWLGRMAKKDIRHVGDGNPGAFNLIKAAGFRLGLVGILLDFMKGYLPLLLIITFLHPKGGELIPLAIAPILGHAFSPFLNFKGGKAMSVSFGVWAALTNFEVAIAYAVILALLMLIARFITNGRSTTSDHDAYQAIIGFAAVIAYLLARHFAAYIIIIWALNLLLLLTVNRKSLFALVRKMIPKIN